MPAGGRIAAVVVATLVLSVTEVARGDEPGGAAGGALSLAPESLSAGAGLSLGSGRGNTTAWRLRLATSLELLPSSGRVDFDLLLPLGLGFQDLSDEVAGVQIAAASLWVELVPSAEVVWAATPELAVVGEAGAGLAWHRTETEVAFQGVVTDTRFAFVLHFAGGVRYALSESVALTATPLGLDVYFLDRSSALFTLLVGVRVRL